MRLFAVLLLFASSSLMTPVKAEGRWNVYGGGSISHLCETPWIGSDKSYGWGGGFFIGGGYEISFGKHWDLTPQLELGFINNGATLSSKELDFYANHSNWMRTWNVSIPVVASYRFSVGKATALRIGAGPYFQESLSGKCYANGTDTKTSLSGTFADRFNLGAMGEIALHTGNHLSYMLRMQYPFLKEGWIRKTMTLSAGIRYSF